MCGIVGYIGHRNVQPVILKGLKRLEYRGYDSAGIALLNGGITMEKVAGKVQDLEYALPDPPSRANVGIGHTRWATHGEPNRDNAHPHISENGKIALIHNGIIENHKALKQELLKRGHAFKSETDTEVLVHLIEDIQEHEQIPLEEAVRLALSKVVGAYAIVVMGQDNPNTLIAARKGSPLVIGIGNEEYFLASDATPIVEYTRNVIYLKDNDVAIVRGDSMVLKTIDNEVQTPYVQELEFSLEQIEKGGYDHFMLKEIHEQPSSINDTMRGRLNVDKGTLKLGGIAEYENKFDSIERIIIIACGTSWHAGLVAEYMFEEYARVPVEVEYASEFRYRKPVIKDTDLVIAISQSGETADTLAAIEMAKEMGAIIFGICNVVGSSIPRATHAGVFTHAGPEIGVASTKAFTSQLDVLYMMALLMAYRRGHIPESAYHTMLNELSLLPQKIQKTIEATDEKIQYIAEQFKDAPNFLYLGRSYNFPVALEGALKLKEISYIHAEGYPAAEMKHGPIALIDENMPVVVIGTNKNNYGKVASNIEEVKARHGKIISIVNEGDTTISELSDYVIEVPETEEAFAPMLSVIPLQLLAYHIAVLRDCNVDQPRNLAKSVTVE